MSVCVPLVGNGSSVRVWNMQWISTNVSGRLIMGVFCFLLVGSFIDCVNSGCSVVGQVEVSL